MKITCEHCESIFNVRWDMEETIGEIKHCPFCGEEIYPEHLPEENEEIAGDEITE